MIKCFNKIKIYHKSYVQNEKQKTETSTSKNRYKMIRILLFLILKILYARIVEIKIKSIAFINLVLYSEKHSNYLILTRFKEVIIELL